ncbi:MAG: hypothetical protein DRJ03_17000 [Chloroflexi bacterium]|nr:MAG: hypothetical protein DRJ03_17000 [Chloroflexota bacterium]
MGIRKGLTQEEIELLQEVETYLYYRLDQVLATRDYTATALDIENTKTYLELQYEKVEISFAYRGTSAKAATRAAVVGLKPRWDPWGYNFAWINLTDDMAAAFAFGALASSDVGILKIDCTGLEVYDLGPLYAGGSWYATVEEIAPERIEIVGYCTVPEEIRFRIYDYTMGRKEVAIEAKKALDEFCKIVF